MKQYYALIVLFLTLKSSYARTQYLDEFLADDNIENEKLLVLLKYSYKVNEVENDKVGDSTDKNFEEQQETVALEYNFSNSSQLRFWMDYTHSFNGVSQRKLIKSPFFSYWRRIKQEESPEDLTGDLGIEISPSLSKGNLYKNKNGHQFLLKYRFGLGDNEERFHGTYFLGYKGGEKFVQEGETREFQPAFMWGVSLSGNFKIYKSIYSSLNIAAVKKSQNQANAFFPNEDSGPSWETTVGAMFFLKFDNGNKLSVGYRFKNESSVFNKFDNGLDIEDEQKSYFVSYIQRF